MTGNLRTLSSVPLRLRGEDGSQAAGHSRGARRDLLPALRLRPLQRGADRGWSQACAECTKCGRGSRCVNSARPPERLRCRSTYTGVGVHGGTAPATQWETLAWLHGLGFRTNPDAERLEVDRRGRRGLRGVGVQAGRGSGTRSTGSSSGRLLRAAGRLSAPARTTEVRPRVQVGADRGDHATAAIHVRVGRTGVLNPLAEARAGPCGRRHGLQRDAPQRGRRSPQGRQESATGSWCSARET